MAQSLNPNVGGTLSEALIQSCSDLLHTHAKGSTPTSIATPQSSYCGSHSTITAVSPLPDALSDMDRPLRAVLSSPQRPSDADPAAAHSPLGNGGVRKLDGRPKNRRAAFRKKSHSLPSFELQAILAARRAKAALGQCTIPTNAIAFPSPSEAGAQSSSPAQSETRSVQAEATAPSVSNHLTSRQPQLPARVDGNALDTRPLNDGDSPSPFTPVTPLSPFTPESQSPSVISEAAIFQQWPALAQHTGHPHSQCSQLPQGFSDASSSEHEAQFVKYIFSKLNVEQSGRSLCTELENATASAAPQCSNGGIYTEGLLAATGPLVDNNVNGSPNKAAHDAKSTDSSHNNVESSSRRAPALVSIEDSSFEAELTEEERQVFYV